MRALYISILILFYSATASWGGSELPYGPESLSGVKPFGVEIRVICSSEVEHHKQVIFDHIKSKLERRGITIVTEGSVILRLTMTAISSDDGFYVVHFQLEALQSAYLAKDNSPTEAAVWDAFRMGEYREQDLLPTVDDLLRGFLNDYISVN